MLKECRDFYNGCVCVQERRKQQQRFRDAQLIQREMSQLERQYDELEDVGRGIEQALRDAAASKLWGRGEVGGGSSGGGEVVHGVSEGGSWGSRGV